MPKTQGTTPKMYPFTNISIQNKTWLENFDFPKSEARLDCSVPAHARTQLAGWLHINDAAGEFVAAFRGA